MKESITHIAEIFSGLYLTPAPGGDVYYLQPKHFKDGVFDPSTEPEVKFQSKISYNLLYPGDVLLAIKGNNNFAVHYKGEVTQAVASSTFIVIRLWDKEAILPGYFTWYLNHPRTQLFFKNQSRGTDILSITIRIVKQLQVYIPSVKKQQTILEIDRLRKEEKDLTQRIANLREKHLQQQLLQEIKK